MLLTRREPARWMLTVKDFEEEAKRVLPSHIYDYIASGAGDEQALQANTGIFSSLFIIPRILSSVSEPNTTTKINSLELSFPFLVAPFGVHKLAHSEGEKATAIACQEEDITLGVSQHATVNLEQVRQAAPLGSQWFQCYILKDRNITLHLLKRAELSGYKAIVITVDSPIFGYRPIDTRNGFQRLPKELSYTNYDDEDKNFEAFARKGEEEGGLDDYIERIFDVEIRWEDVCLIKKNTRLPVFLKGIQLEQDALTACKLGFDGIIISNHGGRQLGCAAPTMATLPGIISLIRSEGYKDFPVLIDSGFRRGEDILKALAMGANAVCIGRPIFWGLAVDGSSGVRKVLQILKRELLDCMKLSGCSSTDDIHHLKLVGDFRWWNTDIRHWQKTQFSPKL
eukprot:jgi/Galph1/2910/GphlegSOOS_G1574.1